MKGNRLPWPIDLAGFYWRRKIRGQSVPLLASFKVTHRCNLSCRACPFHLHADQSHMPRDTAVHALEALRRLGTRIVVFEGGEPLLWRDGGYRLHDLVAYARRRFLRVAVTTNGTLPLDVPADTLWVSLDGWKETHDELRSGSFDAVYSRLKETGHPRVFVHCTINRINWRDLERMAAQVRSLPAVRGMTFQFFYPYGLGEDDLALAPDERRAAVETLLDLKKRGFPILNSAGSLAAMTQKRRSCRDDILINVDPDGTITRGCYVKNRGTVNCDDCGFTPVAEASGALDLLPGSLWAGWKLFLK